jgi:transcriptional regulator with XRE-family HTH domain
MSDRRTLSSSLSLMVVQYLVEQGYSQARLARMLGVSESYISLVKSRERSLTLDHIERICDRLDVTIGAFFMAIGPAPKNPSPRTKRLLKLSAKVLESADKAIEAIDNARRLRLPAKRATTKSSTRRATARRRGASVKRTASTR